MRCSRGWKTLLFKIFILTTFVWLTGIFIAYNLKINNETEDIIANDVPKNEKQKRELKPESIIKEKEDENLKGVGVLLPPVSGDGPGEMGKPVVLSNLTSEQQKLVKEGWNNNKFNQYVSDLISVNRQLPDLRPKECRTEKYPPNLPQTSVIICFTNESWSVLLRTIHSVLSRSPPHLLREIVLVDDVSSMPHLGRQLDTYVSTLEKVKIVRAKTRQGLIRARILGGKHAEGPVLTYLDSHCECTDGWLEPLLARIAMNSTTVVCPVIDAIDKTTFEYHPGGIDGDANIGGFKWNLAFDWVATPEREKKRRQHHWDPLRSPTMAGGLFAIDKSFFEKLGWYDPGYDIWGGENLEISFKAWMCGGSLEIIPCSKVGHVFRSSRPYSAIEGLDHYKRNSVRLAEVWMDEYKEIYYQQINYKLGDYGDVSSRKELRRQLKCKSFTWFVENVYPELFIPSKAIAWGEVRNMGNKGSSCLDSNVETEKKPIAYSCHSQGGNQLWYYTFEGEIKTINSKCLDYTGSDIILYPCHGNKGTQYWKYDSNIHEIKHMPWNRCLAMDTNEKLIVVKECLPNEPLQMWNFQNYNQSNEKNSQI